MCIIASASFHQALCNSNERSNLAILIKVRYELIIFDMDGTLVQSEDCASQALIDVIPALAGESASAITARYRGMRLAKIFDDIEMRIPGAIPEGCLKLYREREESLSSKMITPSEGAFALLQQMKVTICIASNAPIEKTERSLAICGLSGFFREGIFSAYEVGAWKPDPALFLHAAAAFDTDPEKCLVIEDSEVGLEAARSAGMDSVLYDPDESSGVSESQNRVTALANVLELANK